jgi:hypothetical protein
MRHSWGAAHRPMIAELMRRCAASPYRDALRRIPPGLGVQAFDQCAAMRRHAPDMGAAHQSGGAA